MLTLIYYGDELWHYMDQIRLFAWVSINKLGKFIDIPLDNSLEKEGFVLNIRWKYESWMDIIYC